MRMTGARMAIVNSRLNGIARKMANTLLRTGRSGILTIARDFSCCILTAENELLAVRREPADPRAVAGRTAWPRRWRENHPVLRRGDAFLHNSPYHGCTHPADHPSSCR